MEKVSIIVPIYNIENYLKKCVHSLCKQSYKNIEVLLIDDGSTDGSAHICDEFSKIDDRVKVFHEQNGGASKARNKGLDVACGDYIVFVDGDDWLDLDWINYAIFTIKKYNSDIYISNIIKNFSDGKESPYVMAEAEQRLNSFDYLAQTLSWEHPIWEVCGSLSKRKLWDGIRLNEGMIMGEGSIAFWNILKRANSLVFGGSVSYHYYTRNTSTSYNHSFKYFHDSYLARKYFYEDKYWQRDYILHSLIEKHFFQKRIDLLLGIVKICDINSQDFFEKEQKELKCELTKSITYCKTIKDLLKIFICYLPYDMVRYIFAIHKAIKAFYKP